MTLETDNFIKLPVKELAKKIICDGHLYLLLGNKTFYMMKAGVFVDPDFVKKYAVTNQNFDFVSVVNPEVKEKFKTLLRELRYLQFEKDLRNKCFEILAYFQEVYATDEHFLSFALACHEEFCLLPLEDQRRMHETDMHLYRKSLYSSAFSIIIGMANDYYQFLMLRDFYNLTFSLDIGLCDEHYSYFVAEACNEENKVPGNGIKYLEKEKASEGETNLFLSHPERSYDYLKKKNFLAYSELTEACLYQHELSNGNGFPRGVVKGQVSSWEAVIILADALVEISSEYDFEKNVLGHVLDFKNEKIKDLPVERVFKKLGKTLGHFEGLRRAAV